MRIVVLLTSSVIVCGDPVAWAQPSLTPAVDPRTQPVPPGPTKSEALATALAFGSTVAVVTVLAVASYDRPLLTWTGATLMVIGPSVGHVYTGEYGHAAVASLLRAGGLVSFGIGLVGALCVSESDVSCPSEAAMSWLLLGGASVYVAVTAYDV